MVPHMVGPDRIPLLLDAGAQVSGRMSAQTGVPFARGALADVATLAVVDEAGVALPLQAQVVSRWPDGSVKWALLNFSADLRDGQGAATLVSGGEPASVRLRNLGEVGSRAPLQVEETADSITVTTGPLRFRISKRRFTIVDAAWFAEDGRFPAESALRQGATAAFVVNETGKTFSTALCCGPDYSAVVERCGAEHVAIRCDGWHVAEDGSRFLQGRVRIHADAGQAVIRVVYTIIVAEPPGSQRFVNLSNEVPPRPYWFYHYELSKTAWDYIAGWNIVLALAKRSRRALLGGKGEVKPPADLIQWSERTYRVREGSQEIAVGERAPGWADVSGDGVGITFGVCDFWQNYCKRIAVGDDSIAVGLWPDEAGQLEIAVGAAKTHEFVLRFHVAGESASDVETGIHRAAAQVIASAAPEYYAATGVFGEFTPADPERFPVTEAALAKHVVQPLAGGRSGGIIAYGDFHCVNNEEDHTNSNVVQYLRTGDPQILRDLAPVVRHYCDLDVRHWNTNQHIAGGALLHGHTVWSVNACHYYFEAALGYGLLTGDERIMEVARQAGYAIIGMMESGKERHGVRGRACHDSVVHGELCSRDAGRMIIFLSTLYAATGNPDYLAGAEAEIDYVRRAQLPDGTWHTFSPAWLDEKLGFARTADPATENCFSDCGPGVNSFTLRGLMLYLRATDGLDGHDKQRRVAANILSRGVEGAVNTGMNADQSFFLYGTWAGNPARFQHSRGHMWYNNRRVEQPGASTAMLPLLVLAARVSGNEGYRCIADRVYGELVKRGDIGQPAYMGPYLADLIARGGGEPNGGEGAK